jgi:nitroreductase
MPIVSASDAASSVIDATVAAVIRGRRTIGAFRPDVPPRETILAALELARWAPNHKKTEPWQIVWLGPEAMNAVIELNTRILRESKGVQEAEAKRKKWAETPGWLVVTCELAADLFRREEDYAACCCAIQNLSLALWSAGIGTKWSTGEVTRHPDFYKLIGIDPALRRTVGLIWYGFPAVQPEQTRRPLETFLRELP